MRTALRLAQRQADRSDRSCCAWWCFRHCLPSAHNETTVAVTDSGIGLASGSEDEIFGAFVQNDQSIDRPQGGLGLGLALVRQIVQLHGGSVKATSPGEGLGTCITVTLPAVLPTIVSQP